ncbi:membrane protein implicated in regulation of membrane protease activity [Phycicoccus badiiscoriae]|uniref:Membrane protein implicated in regulation of membrane protease activity n=1 Tax=Pedococcus badiiscoriae TaxID=642776 RepID=A0A852WMD7_9MICO|nr:hypothetical protein [Pedococcus badiiscoriae]NYG06596.1 membrane protein implicated in regulation of membrane protease activity [Pedococcus badiiscoriae]
MIVFGLILALLALAAGVVLFLATRSITHPVDLELAGYHWGMTPLALLVTGAVAMLLFWLGLAAIRGSVVRRRRPIREAKDAERQAKLEESIRADERARAEETHQSTLAERDRVRDEEYQTRLADRDRERDSELASREEEFAARERATEERVRADERRKVEQEFASRAAGPGAGAAAGAGVGTAAATGVGMGAAAGSAETSAASPTTDAASVETPGRHAADADTADHLGSDQPTTDSTQLLHEGDAGSRDETADGSRDETAEGGLPSDESPEPGYRTVADKIMGRDPVARD